ncbi:hypothetical protein HMPREF1554_01337, partial [Porphyromonas gingivalis F0569]
KRSFRICIQRLWIYIRSLWIEIFRPEKLFLSAVGETFPGRKENNRTATNKTDIDL